MRMTDEQLNRLADADEPMARMCFHGMRIIHDCPENNHEQERPVFILRFVGHLLSDHDPFMDAASEDEVPERNIFSIDLPFHPPTLADVASTMSEAAAQAFICDMFTGAKNGNVVSLFGDGEMPKFVSEIPDEIKNAMPPFLREILFGDEDGKGN